LKGREDISGAQQLGVFLRETAEGDIYILRGKFQERKIEEVPRGFIRKYVLNAWREDMTPRELEIFEQYGRKDD
tara:strand:- start:1216 stop:1437 length:222 start_codon:yes stop_codon:yes gene_type:complete